MATTTFSGVSTTQEVFNEFDELGLLLGIDRLPEEVNSDYKQRLLTTFSQRANSTYTGLVNGISRGLGVDIFDAIEINLVTTSGVPDATDPNVVFDEAFVYLYEDYSLGDEGLDATVDRFEITASGYHLTDLVDRINESAYFTASIVNGVDPYTRSMTIVNQSMQVQVVEEEIPQIDKFELENSNVIDGTVFFSETSESFRLEVDTEAEVNSKGKYHIDYTNGIVTVFTLAPPGTTVRYKYRRNPMVCTASPVIIHNVQDQDFKAKMFEQIVTDEGETVNGIVTSLGANLVNELLSVVPVYWGE